MHHQTALPETVPRTRWANVRRHNGSVDEPGGSTTSGSGPNSGPAGSSRSGHYGGSYDQGDDHIINRQLSGGERTRSGHNSSQCTGYAVNTF